ncbi:MAG: sulfite exporter TauE/SafE family protein, partial [Patescibacteria group bacterium]
MITQTHEIGLSDEKKLKITSFAASALSGFFGTAGSLFFNWMVQWWLERDMKRANGLTLATISISVLTSIIVRILWPIQILHIDWQKAQILLISIAFGMIGAVFGNLYEKRLKEKHLRQLFIGILLFVGLKLLGVIPEQLFTYISVGTWTTTAAWSLIAGIGSPLLGMGAGVLVIPTFLSIGFSRDESILASLIVSAFLMLFSTWLFHRAKRLDTQDLRHVWLPAIIGTPVGVWLSYQISPEHFQSLFGIMLIVGAGKTLYDISANFRQLI